MPGLLLAMLLVSASQEPVQDGRIGLTHGSDIIARCTDAAPQNGSFCFGFIAGVFESVRAYESWLNIKEICVPASVTLADMRDTVVKRITDHPNDRLGQGASVVVLALKDRWPCQAAPKVLPPSPVPEGKPLPSKPRPGAR